MMTKTLKNLIETVQYISNGGQQIDDDDEDEDDNDDEDEDDNDDEDEDDNDYEDDEDLFTYYQRLPLTIYASSSFVLCLNSISLVPQITFKPPGIDDILNRGLLMSSFPQMFDL